ncbi:unnamed protein product [Closterium sp. Naga37s-1]|nr:unnamed protein product [Closterium sp. Naga37s-1]
MSTDGIVWVDVLLREMGQVEEKDDDELTDAEDDYAQDVGKDILYSEDVEDAYYDAAEAPELVVEEGNAAAAEDGGTAPDAEERDGGEEGGPEAGAEEGDREQVGGLEAGAEEGEREEVGGPGAGAEEADDEETESEYGDPIQIEQERQAEEEDGEEEETEYLDASDGDDDDDSSDDEDDEETDSDFSDASDDDMDEGGSTEQGHEEAEIIDMENPDEVGMYFGDDAKLSWEGVDDSVQHLHGPRLAHQVLGRGVSIRKIRFANMFVHFCRSSTQLKGKADLPVLVIASRKTKTNLSNNLTHQYLARHIDWQLCGVGGVFLWIHWLYDLVPTRYGKKVLRRLNFRKPRKWAKKHLFFGIRKPSEPPPQAQDEMKYETHNNWIKWVMTKARWMFSKVTHIFRRSGAQGLSDDRCPDNDIGALGGWEQGEMRKAYIIGIPFLPMLLMAGFSGSPGDYYIGRAHAELPVDKEWKKLQKLFKKHIFPWAEKELKKNARFWIEGQHELVTVRAENHCLRKASGMKDVRNAELEAQVRELQSAKKKMDEEMAQLKAALAALTVSSPGSIAVDNAAAGGEGSSRSGNGGAGPSTPQPATPTPDIYYFDTVVRPWRDCTTVADAWALWNKSSFLVGGRTLREVAEEAGFIVKWAHYKIGKEIKEEKGKFEPTVRLAAKGGTCERQLRRNHKAMTAVEMFRVDESLAATTEAVNVLDEVLFQTSPSTFADGLIVKDKRGTKRQRTATAGGKSQTDDAQERVSYLLVFYGQRDNTWAEDIFGASQWLSINDEESQKPLK